MSMITGCPACGTLFKVVPDQLKISEGWVRCGHCGEVFDATAHMQQAAAASGDPAARPAPTPAPTPTPTPAPLPAATAPEPEPAPQRREAEASDAGPESVLPHFLSRRDEHAPSELPLDFGRSELDMPASMFTQDDWGLDEEEAVEQVSFVRNARRQAFWRRPLVRAVLSLAALALAALLAGQVALHERDTLAATQPQLRPWLARACAVLQCTIGPPRRIEAIAIDASTFTKLRPDAYRLSFTLKNQAALPVAVPSLELTLTDTQDQPLMRRVLNPREMGATAETLPAASDWSSSLAIGVAGDASAARIAGYRLLAFYP